MIKLVLPMLVPRMNPMVMLVNWQLLLDGERTLTMPEESLQNFRWWRTCLSLTTQHVIKCISSSTTASCASTLPMVKVSAMWVQDKKIYSKVKETQHTGWQWRLTKHETRDWEQMDPSWCGKLCFLKGMWIWTTAWLHKSCLLRKGIAFKIFQFLIFFQF